MYTWAEVRGKNISELMHEYIKKTVLAMPQVFKLIRLTIIILAYDTFRGALIFYTQIDKNVLQVDTGSRETVLTCSYVHWEIIAVKREVGTKFLWLVIGKLLENNCTTELVFKLFMKVYSTVQWCIICRVWYGNHRIRADSCDQG